MSRQPDRIKHTYELDNTELHAAVRAHLGIGPEPVMSIEWDSYGDTAEAEVTITVKAPGSK